MMGMSEERKHDINRRDFIKWSAVAATVATTSGLVACEPKATDTDQQVTEANPYTDGEWKAAQCWAACGGNCVNQVLVKDGVALYQKTDTFGDDNLDNPQQRGCHRGRSLRKFVFSDQRIKYPLKRKGWQPGGGENSNGQLRGIDEWERVSWDEAFAMTAAEIKRIVAEVGNTGIIAASVYGSPAFLNAYGGCAGVYGPTSSGGFIAATTRMVGGGWTWAPLTLSDRFELRKSKLIVLWGHNPVTVSQGNAILNLFAAQDAGAEFIVVDPCYTETAKVLNAEFIPVRPSTDTALLLALAHEMITNNLHDQEFLDKYTVGFDAGHMPEGADSEDNFKDYVLGTYDGTPKTAEWASEICGTPVETIKAFANRIATTKPLAFTCARASARTIFGEQFSQAFLTVGWMTGEVGKPGSMAGHVVTNNNGSGGGGSMIVVPGSSGGTSTNYLVSANPLVKFGVTQIDPSDTETMQVNYSELWEAILNKEFMATSRGKIPIDIRMYTEMPGNNNAINQVPGVIKGIEAMRALEFVLVAADRMNPSASYADIIMPWASAWEAKGNTCFKKTNRDNLLASQQICEPLFESKQLDDIQAGIAQALEVDVSLVKPVAEEQKAFNQLAGAVVMGPDGVASESLFTITAEDIPDGVEGEPQEGRITLKEFFENKLYKIDRYEGDGYGFIALKDYVDNPIENARPTASGKLEIHCQALADFVAGCGFSQKSPIARYQVPTIGYESTFSDWENKIKGPYPLQSFSTHTFRTAHSMFDGHPYTREAFQNNIQINTKDAEERGIKDGDTVLITSTFGSVLRNAWVSERIMPGVTRLDQSAWVEIDPETGINRSGNPNVLNGQIPSGPGIQAYNSSNIQVEKYDGAPLELDYLWPERIVEV
jgi:anaerobic dimethyl sulfoxide reductase subunit A